MNGLYLISWRIDSDKLNCTKKPK